VRDIDSIDDPTWKDLHDRESEIRRLKQEIEEIKAELADLLSENERLLKSLRRTNALLGVP
jgi:regulator of replication initiation timing